MGTVNSVVDILNGITRIAMALVPLGIVLGVLFGANADLFNNVIINLINIIKLFSKESLIGLIALGIVIWLFGISGSASKSGSA